MPFQALLQCQFAAAKQCMTPLEVCQQNILQPSLVHSTSICVQGPCRSTLPMASNLHGASRMAWSRPGHPLYFTRCCSLFAPQLPDPASGPASVPALSGIRGALQHTFQGASQDRPSAAGQMRQCASPVRTNAHGQNADCPLWQAGCAQDEAAPPVQARQGLQ